eukprot:1157712-Pelagomonas_calceolata.AAC.3
MGIVCGYAYNAMEEQGHQAHTPRTVHFVAKDARDTCTVNDAKEARTKSDAREARTKSDARECTHIKLMQGVHRESPVVKDARDATETPAMTPKGRQIDTGRKGCHRDVGSQRELATVEVHLKNLTADSDRNEGDISKWYPQSALR